MSVSYTHLDVYKRQVIALAEGGKQLVHVFLGVGRIGTRRLLEAQAQGVGSDAQGEKGQGQKQDVLREVPLADIQEMCIRDRVQNPNKTVEAIDPVIEVVGKDDSGNVIFDETIETPGVLPDSTYYYSYVAGSTADSSANSTEVVKPATVEFSITTPEGSWEATDQKLAHVYAVQDGGATDTQFGAKEFTGTVTASESLDGATQSRVDVVLLDQDVYKRQVSA